VEVGGGGLEEPEGEALIHPRRCRRGGRAATSPCSGAHRGNRREGRATGEGAWAVLARPASAGGSKPKWGRGFLSPQLFPFLLFFSPFFLQPLHLPLATIDFAKLCHWPKQSQRIKVHCLKKVGRLLE